MERRRGGSTGHISLLRAALAGIALVLHPPVLCRGTSPAEPRDEAAARVPPAASVSEDAASTVAGPLGANATALRRTPRSVEDVRKFIAGELRPTLLAQSLRVSGGSYRFGPPDGGEELTVIVIRYPSSRRRRNGLSGRSTAFVREPRRSRGSPPLRPDLCSSSSRPRTAAMTVWWELFIPSRTGSPKTCGSIVIDGLKRVRELLRLLVASVLLGTCSATCNKRS